MSSTCRLEASMFNNSSIPHTSRATLPAARTVAAEDPTRLRDVIRSVDHEDQDQAAQTTQTRRHLSRTRRTPSVPRTTVIKGEATVKRSSDMRQPRQRRSWSEAVSEVWRVQDSPR
jgi:hypothetical protein